MADLRLEGPIAGNPFQVTGGFDLAADGYAGEEYFLRGTACAYTQVGDRGDDGVWQAKRGASASFTTRILVRRPIEPADFNGTVVIEWMNVSGGLDAAPDWLFLHRHLMRKGAIWIGLSAQKAGIDGGGIVPGMPLKKANPKRYGDLHHPGDGFAFDIMTQTAKHLRRSGAGPLGPIGGDSVERIIAMGESQSAGFLVTYVNAIDPIEQEFDGFFIHGRPASAATIDGSYMRASKDEDISRAAAETKGVHFLRAEPRVPVMVLQSETDVVSLQSGRVRQPDGDNLRLWEIAGAAHFDTYGLSASMTDHSRISIEELAALMAPTDKPMGMAADLPVNSGPQQHYVANAAFAHLERQLRDGTPMPTAPRMQQGNSEVELLRDDLGIVRGGIRTPWVDAPSVVLSGLGQSGDGFLFLFGTTVPLDAATLDRLYPGGVDEQRDQFLESLERALAQGYLLEADAEEIRALSRIGRPPSGWLEG